MRILILKASGVYMRHLVKLVFIGYGLVSCSGGGGGGSAPPPPPANRAPTITAASATIAENTQGPLLAASATDPDSDPLTFSIVGGEDAGAFSINSQTGEVVAVEQLDFEQPADLNSDNNYTIMLSVSDGVLQDSITVTISVTNIQNDGLVKLVGRDPGDSIGQVISAAPDYDNDMARDLSLSLFKFSGALNDIITYVLFSGSFGAETSEEFNLGSFDAQAGVAFSVSGLSSNPASSFAALEASGVNTSTEFLQIDHPLSSSGEFAVTQFLDGAPNQISALGGQVDAGAGISNNIVRSSIDGSLIADDSPERPVFESFQLGSGLAALPNASFRPAGDINSDGIIDYTVGAAPVTATGSLATEEVSVFIISGAVLAADSDGFISQEDLSFPDIVEVMLANVDTQIALGEPGDLNGDGFAELIISASRSSGDIDDRVYVLDGKQIFQDADGIVLISDLPGALGRSIIIGTAGPSRKLRPVSAGGVGDIDNDGVDDIFVGIASDRSVALQTNRTSSLFVLSGMAISTFGGQNFPLSTNLDLGAGAEIISEVIDDLTVLQSDGFGAEVVRSFDLDNDDDLDLVVGAPFSETLQGNDFFLDSVGSIYIIPSSRVRSAMAAGGAIDLGREF